MKRTGFLIEKIADPENLRLAFWKAKKAKEGKQEIIDYSKNIENNIGSLHHKIIDNAVLVGSYNYFNIYDPKLRRICAASFEERILHHALMNICHPYFEKYQIHNSYATRIGKGQYAAIERAKCFQKKYLWFCKLDVRKYFDTINHGVLKNLLRKMFKDEKLLQIYDKIIDSYCTTSDTGLPIGNLTSQYFANHYLAVADHYALEQLGIPAYIRYMDDMVFWGNDKSKLLEQCANFIAFIEMSLKLKLKTPCLNSCVKGLSFLGYVLFPNNIRLNKTSKKRFIKKMKQYNTFIINGAWSQEEYHEHITPLLSFPLHASTHTFRNKLIKSLETG